MPTRRVTYNFKGIEKIEKGFLDSVKSAKPFFSALAGLIDKDTHLQFRLQGARVKRWKRFKMSTLKTSGGTWKIRYGTDKEPRRSAKQLKEYKTKNNLWYKPGPMKGYRSAIRYSAKSKLLRSSGLFEKSYRKMRVSNNILLYGTTHKLADVIQRRGRQVLFVTRKDERRYSKLWQGFLFRNLFK